MKGSRGREVSRQERVDESNHRAALEIAKHERSLVLGQVKEESNALDLSDRHDLFGRLTSKLGDNVLATRAALEAKAQTEADLAALRPLAETYIQLTVEAQQHYGRRLLG